MIEESKNAIEEARKVVEREQLLQSEALMKRLAEKRQKNRLQTETLNLTTGNFMDSYDAKKAANPVIKLNSCEPEDQEEEKTKSIDEVPFKIESAPVRAVTRRMTVPKVKANPYDSPEGKKRQVMVQGSSLASAQPENVSPPGLSASSNFETTSFLSYGGRSNGLSMMLANKISLALSRVVSAKSNGQMVDSDDEEEEIKDLV